MQRSGAAEGDYYLDDFITIGPPGSDEHQRNLDIMLDACCSLGVPGIETDALSGVLQFPAETLARICQTLSGCTTERNWSS